MSESLRHVRLEVLDLTIEPIIVVGILLGVLATIAGRLLAGRVVRLRATWRPVRAEKSPSKVELQPQDSPYHSRDDATEAVVSALLTGRCVLVAGLRISAGDQELSPHSVTQSLITDSEILSRLGLTSGDPLSSSMSRWQEVADILTLRLPRNRIIHEIQSRRATATETRDRGLHPWGQREGVSSLSRLSLLPFNAVISLDWGNGIERAFSARKPVYFGADGMNLDIEHLRENRFYVIKPYGRYEDADSLTVSLDDFRRRTDSHPELARMLRYILNGSTMLFLGVDLLEIASLLDAINLRQPVEFRHVALVPTEAVKDDSASLLVARHGLNIVPVSELAEREQVDRFLDGVRSRLRQARTRTRTHDDGDRLEAVRLTNIGPFASLHLRFDDSWTVLLGDNGSGKSSVLRAIALGLSGSDAHSAYLQNMLKVGERWGAVEVVVGGRNYTTELIRDRTSVRARSLGVSPVEAGTMLALGFPAVRGIPARTLSGPQAFEAYPGGDPNDLAPLLAGDVDRRLDDIRQWLVNLASLGSEGTLSGRPSQRDIELAFTIFGKLAKGLNVSPAGLDKVNWDLLLNIGGDRIPLSLLSQGSLSMMGWVGVLMKRLKDTQGRQEDKEGESLKHRRALVIIDELDAHLHPEWQRNIIGALGEAFPSVQFVASTHSPLVVGALAQGVLTIHRDGNGVGMVEASRSFLGWRADQILTSSAFGLDTTRDSDSEGEMREYENLLSLGHEADARQQRRLRQLEDKFGAEWPRSAETPEAREVASVIDDALDARIRDAPVDEAQRMLIAAKDYLRRVRGEDV